MTIYVVSVVAALLSCMMGYGAYQCPGLPGESRAVVHLDEGSWEQLLQGEWMVVFCMPLVENCTRLERVWNNFATAMQWKEERQVEVASMQVEYAGTIAARFSLDRLPSVLHVRDGIFRELPVVYTVNEWLQLALGQWKKTRPMPFWRQPNGCIISAKLLYLQAINMVYGTEFFGGDYNRATLLVGIGSFLLFSISVNIACNLYGLLRDTLLASKIPEVPVTTKEQSQPSAAGLQAQKLSVEDENFDSGTSTC